MSKFDKFREILDIAGPMAKPFLPGGAGTVLDAVTKGLDSHASPPSGASSDAIKQLAKRLDDDDARLNEQEQAILALHERLKKAGF